MNLLFSCIGKRGYVADFFRPHLAPGDRIIGTGNTPWTSGFEACDAAFLLPDIVEDAYVPAVLDLCARESVGAVLSFADPDVFKLAQHRDEFVARGIVPLLPSPEVADTTYDKFKTHAFLKAEGFATPATMLHPTEAAGLPFPLYVKPRWGSGSASTFLARNEDELRVFFDYQPDMLVQEAVEGEEIDIELCGDLDGRPVGFCSWRKHRSRLGETEQAETFKDPTVVEFGLRLGEALRIIGPVDVDIIRRDGTLVVLEANTRFGGGYPVSHLAGADFPRLLMDLVRHGKTEADFAFSHGVAMMKRLDVIGGDKDSFFTDTLRLR